MIRISLGKVGSGKTANEVREIFLNKAQRKTYSNIQTKLKNQIELTADMIFKKEVIKTVKKKNGDTEVVYDYKLNLEYWKNIKEPINVVLDEAHNFWNSRTSMSKKNIILQNYLALIRRILGQNSTGYGELVLVSQNIFRLDVVCRESATQIRYHICHYTKTCNKCSGSWKENSEMAEPLWICPYCGNVEITKHKHYLEIFHFAGLEPFLSWDLNNQKTFYRHYLVNGIEKYFGLYDTLQWDNLLGD